MRRIMIAVFIITVSLLTGYEEGQASLEPVELSDKGGKEILSPLPFREQDPPPACSFVPNGDGESTTLLYNSYYDYFPFSYNGCNVHHQPPLSLPYGFSADGFYIGYQCSETPQTSIDRRAWYSYLNPDRTLFCSNGIFNIYPVYREGFVTSAVDPVTADPFFAWHSIVEEDTSYDCLIAYDSFHLTGSPGYWRQPFILFDNPETSEPLTGEPDDEFIWPVLMIGTSPFEGMSRVHAYANNYTSNNAGQRNYNSIHAYADFNADSLLIESDLTWTFQTFPYLDHLHYDDIARIKKDMLVYQEKVAFIGSYGDSLFCLLSEDYGENFVFYTQEWKFPVGMPLNEDLTPWWLNGDGSPAELYFVLSKDGSHYNAVWAEQGSRILWMTGINLNSQEYIGQSVYIPDYFYPKIFIFDVETHTFDFVDVDFVGVDPYDEQPAIPWDLDEDGQVDEYNDDGSVNCPLSMPSWFFNSDQDYQNSWDEASFRMAACDQYVVAVWQDCKKARWAYFSEDGYEGWFQQPEIAIILSADGGETWSQPRYVNSNPNDNIIDPENHYEGNFAPELADMSVSHLALGQELEVTGDPDNPLLRLYLAFFDDSHYGSGVNNFGPVTLGSLRFATLDLEPQTGTNDNVVPEFTLYLAQNYPNPFNPVTTISFQLPAGCDKAELAIYNIKGQLIRKYLMNPSNHEPMNSIIWDGTDEKGMSVASGLYFYTLESEKIKSTKKMILLK